MITFSCLSLRLFIASLIEPKAWSLYLASVIIGYGASSELNVILMNYRTVI